MGMGHGGQGQDILGIQVVNQDSCIVVPYHFPLKNPRKRERVLASFGSPQRSRKFDFALGSLELKEMDDETEMVRI